MASNLTTQLRVLFLILCLVGVGIVVLVVRSSPLHAPTSVVPPEAEPVLCTQDALQCPDGSYVGRTGPHCEFSPCPSVPSMPLPDNWETQQDAGQGITFSYPARLSLEYIHPVQWPPRIEVLNQEFSCKQGGSAIMEGGQVTQKQTNGETYCVTTQQEGAAGSVYSTYAYSWGKNHKTVTITFTLRSVQCANYDESRKIACEQEQASFNVDTLATSILQSVRFPS